MASSSSDGHLNKMPISPRVQIPRPGYGTKGQQIRLCTNHFRVSADNKDVIFYHYHVNLKYENDQPVDRKGLGRKVIDKLQETYASDLVNMKFAYDGEKSLFTVGALQNVKDVFTVVLEDTSSEKTVTSTTPGGNESPGGSDMKRMKRSMQAKTFKVELSLAGNVPMSSIAKVLRGHESYNYQEALRVLDIILRQNSAKQGCLLVRQSFFHNNTSNFSELGGGIVVCSGYHSSFRPTQSGLSLNVDLSMTVIVKPGPVIDFLLSNQDIKDKDARRIDWGKAKRVLKNLRIKTTHSQSEFKIVGLSEKSCYEQTFPLKQSNGSGTTEVTVYNYYMQHWNWKLKYDNLPCLNVGKPKRPTYIPIELCNLVSLQRYTKALTVLQRASLVEKSRQNPRERKSALSVALHRSNYNSDNMLKKCGISIAPEFAQVAGRVLQAPKLKAGDGRDLVVRNGRWNFNNNRLIQARRVKRWAVVNFSSRCNARNLAWRIIQCGNAKGMQIDREDGVIEERPEMRQAPAANRVDSMFDQMKSRLPEQPTFILCVLPDRKNCDIYGPWKRKCLADFGIFTQCLAPPQTIKDQYLTNVLLKINAKLGGLNSLLQMEASCAIPLVSRAPTIIFGMDVSHGSPGQSDVPSIAAVVSSLKWPLISKYKASVCAQLPKLEMIDSLFKPEGDKDHGLIRELLRDFMREDTKQQKPEQIIIFRDGVSEGQFNQVLNIELTQIIEACKYFDAKWSPKFTVIVAQKNHHTRFFLHNGPRGDDVANVSPGTVVDTGICHPRNYDFYMCAHAGMIGTTRPTHYHVLHDEIGFSPDDLQELVHSLSYVYQRSTSAISVVAPVYYAHLAAAQVRQFVKFDDASETASSGGGPAPVPELPRLHDSVRSSMFFC